MSLTTFGLLLLFAAIRPGWRSSLVIAGAV